ncbi:MAG TPA: phenylalanine--tRNA ligase subunit beta, partial [Candidatus Paceibacterota bacterium]|nr:phenylalanine--tRNA ligase subunit beta [Candidatus Paceibacterota bacterium]
TNTGEILEVDLLSNRVGDVSNHLGLSRELAAITNRKLKMPPAELKLDSKIKIEDYLKVKIQNNKKCRRYSCRLILGVTVKPSPIWMQEKLVTCGLRPINNIVDATNYTMLELGQPLHAFDYERIDSTTKGEQGPKLKNIVIRDAKKGEIITTLDNDTYKLDESTLVIADSHEPLGIAGIKGGQRAAISSFTKNIVVESANFDYWATHLTSVKLQLKTDASWRFEHKLPPELTEIALNRVCHLIQKIAGGTIAKEAIDVGVWEDGTKGKERELIVPLERFAQIIGQTIDLNEAKKKLNALGFKVKNIKKNKVSAWLVTIPYYRLDITEAEDIIGEAARLIGYDSLQSQKPLGFLTMPEPNEQLNLEARAKDYFISQGFYDVYTYSFIGNNDYNELNAYWQNRTVNLVNPVSQDAAYLQPLSFINLLKGLKNTEKQVNDFLTINSIRLISTGKTYEKNNNQFKEFPYLAGVLATFTEEPEELLRVSKGIIIRWLAREGLQAHFSLANDERYTGLENIDSKTILNIEVEDQVVGWVSFFKRETLITFNQIKSVLYFHIDEAALLGLVLKTNANKQVVPLTKYPAAKRDLSILIQKNVSIADILKLINDAQEGVLEDVEVFDIYAGKNLPEDKKSVAFHLLFRHKDRTLSAEEINQAMDKIERDLMARWNVEVR